MNPTKPGYLTSEFWLSAGAAGVLALLAKLNLSLDVSGLNPILAGLAHWAIPLAIAWITSRYGDGRAQIKTAAIAAGNAASGSPDKAAIALNEALKK